MAQTFRQRIAQAEAMARADMLRFQPEVCVSIYSILFSAMYSRKKGSINNYDINDWSF